MIRISSPVDRLLLLWLGVVAVSLLVTRVHGQDASESAAHFAENQEKNAAPSQSEGYWRPTADDLDNILEAVDGPFRVGFTAEDNVAAQILPRLDRSWVWDESIYETVQILKQLRVADSDRVPRSSRMSSLREAICDDIGDEAVERCLTVIGDELFRLAGDPDREPSLDLNRLDHDFPFLARLRPWFDRNEAVLDEIVAASRGEHWFVPTALPSANHEFSLQQRSEKSSESLKRLAALLSVRSLLAAEQGDLESAWADCLAMRNLSLFLAQSQSLLDTAAFSFVLSMACDNARFLFEKTDIVAKLGAKRLLADWVARAPNRTVGLRRQINIHSRGSALYTTHRSYGRLIAGPRFGLVMGALDKDDELEMQRRWRRLRALQIQELNELVDKVVDVLDHPTAVASWQEWEKVDSEIEALPKLAYLIESPILLRQTVPEIGEFIAWEATGVDRHRMVALALAAAAGGPDRNEVEATLASIDSAHSPEHWLHSSVDGFAFVLAAESGRVIVRRDLERQTGPKIARVQSLNDSWQVAVPVDDR